MSAAPVAACLRSASTARSPLLIGAAAIGLCLGGVSPLAAQADAARRMEAFLGTWHGSSVCVDREIAPACKDELVIYEVRRSPKADTAVLKADKLVDGKRDPMGELEFAYDPAEGCWRSELQTPRVHAYWCLSVSGDELAGWLRELPRKAAVRSVLLRRR